MIWNLIKQIFWCGVFHKTKVTMDTGYPDLAPTEEDQGQLCYCVHCGTYYEVRCV